MTPTSYLTIKYPSPRCPRKSIVLTQFKVSGPFWGTPLHFLTGPNSGEYSKSTTHVHLNVHRETECFFLMILFQDVKFCDSHKCLLWIPKGSSRVSEKLMQTLKLTDFLQGLSPDLASYLLSFPQRIQELSDCCILHTSKFKSNYRLLSLSLHALFFLELSSFSQKSTGISSTPALFC